MNNDDVWLTIGEAAERTGLPVKTVRYYADIGLVPSTDRSPTGYRLYDASAVARLDLVRTLRDLDFDLASIRAFLDRAVTLSELATSHAAAIDAQMRILRARRSVLRAVSRLGIDDQKELETMNRLAQLSAEERQRIIDEYWDETFSGLDLDPQFVQMSRSVQIDLPDDPSQEQVDAWIELAELVQDPDYRARVRQMAQASHDARGSDEAAAAGAEQAELFGRVSAVAGPLREAGVAPESERAQDTIRELAEAFAALRGTDDGPGFRRRLADEITTFSDRRVERFWELVGVVNGWPQDPSRSGGVATMEWFAAALRA
ncbi:MerR family transcriptional regulator [Phytoactinopolyspora endophytica]|uniref:helix-turn-helix domain-containing protein n=1 Tax=Phytoactinopolyspora endophytica TaxID=1642495 RepID=UPI00197B8926|nr:MerR family transcriptional regulator [Phytoactinopolyspora endophytica]